ncbi:MAG: DUF3047 domain-containing protein [Lentisphaerae bacterium]|nr:DUF3047 domain-containing protein [Lentisphaerota bacterium]
MRATAAGVGYLAVALFLAGPARAQGAPPAWRLTFASMPADWDVRGVPGRPKAIFEAGYADGSNRVLRMTSDKATAAFKSGKLGVDLTRTPIMRWRWKAVTLPAGADGSREQLDDQAIGLYVSTGGMMRQKSVAYRWETDTPKGAEGRAKYAAGVVSLFWRALRNKDDLGNDGWFVEEVNVAEDFRRAFGDVPTNVGLGISCNSQFTGTKAEALLDWVEFRTAAP